VSERVRIQLLSALQPHFQPQIYLDMDTRTHTQTHTHAHTRARSLSFSPSLTHRRGLLEEDGAELSWPQASICNCCIQARISVCVCVCSIRQHTSAYVSIRQRQASATVVYKRAYPCISHTRLPVRSCRCLPLTYADVC
jgi:hypothetical protein